MNTQSFTQQILIGNIYVPGIVSNQQYFHKGCGFFWTETDNTSVTFGDTYSSKLRIKIRKMKKRKLAMNCR